MLKKSEKIIYIITFVILIIVIVIVFLLKFKSHSILKNKEDVVIFLEKHFGDTDFEIGERITMDAKVCDGKGYSWKVTSNKSGIIFDVYEEGYSLHGNNCIRGIFDNYDEKLNIDFNKKEKIEKDEYDNYIFNISDYNSNEELANTIYNLIDKYYLDEKGWFIKIYIMVGDEKIYVSKSDINSPEDIINNYLS